MEWTIRPAVFADFDVIRAIYTRARSFMADNGNPSQWGTSYPPDDLIRQDIDTGKCYVCIADGRPAGVFYYAKEEEPTYRVIEGRWENDAPYGVVHRIASSMETKGIASFCLNWAYEQCGNLRIDTHDDNMPMQHLLQKLGFRCCGRIYLADGSPRIAFQKSKD